jgi:hypothetical protein
VGEARPGLIFRSLIVQYLRFILAWFVFHHVVRSMSAGLAFALDAASASGLRGVFDRIGYHSDTPWAWDHYKSSIVALSQEYGLTRHMEIGGGRDPLFTPEEAAAHGFDMVINDISPVELKPIADRYRTACFDVAGDQSTSPIPAWSSSM